MTSEQIVGLLLALGVMFIGVAGSILPGLPGTPLVLVAAIGHRLYFGPLSVGNWAMAGLVGLTLLSIVVDYLATVYGARRFGATRKGIIGAIVGMLIGLCFSFPGVVAGPFLGAMAFEMAGGRKTREAAKAGLGALIGLLTGTIGKLACCLLMIALFTVSVLWQTLF